MNRLFDIYYTTASYLFPMVEEEIGEITSQMKEFLRFDDVWALRKQLLTAKGVGWETADSILLYAFNKPIFVIDAYTRRVAERHLGLDGSVHYDVLQKTFMGALLPDTAIYNEYHAMIVVLCKESCRKSGCGEICKKLDCSILAATQKRTVGS